MEEDPYLTGTYRWWHLSTPSPELVAAIDDRWLTGTTALDLGCGAGSEVAYLAGRGFTALGVDLSAAAVVLARRQHPHCTYVQADVLCLPLATASFDIVLDRGCFHYLSPADRAGYVAETGRVLRAGGRLLLRACLTSRGVRNDLTLTDVLAAFDGWTVDEWRITTIPSDTRTMRAVVARLRRA